jgi:hypothetical protein
MIHGEGSDGMILALVQLINTLLEMRRITYIGNPRLTPLVL